jgi:hypothetical protein
LGLRHASIRTTGDVYMQTIESSVLSAMNSRTMQILADKEKAVTAASKMPVRKALVPKVRGFWLQGLCGNWTKF